MLKVPICTGRLYNNVCIYVHNVPMTWSDGQTLCSILGGHHIVVEDTAKQRQLMESISSDNRTFWLGGKLNLQTEWIKTAGYTEGYDILLQ